MKFTPYPHQIEKSNEALKILQENGLVYLAMEERTGKTFTSIMLVQKFSKAAFPGRTVEVVVLTKKNALMGESDSRAKSAKGGWYGSLRLFTGSDGQGTKPMMRYEYENIRFTVTNYHKSHLLDVVPDIVILDEAHTALTSFPEVGKIWESVDELMQKNRQANVIYMSATPHAQGHYQLYHQMVLCNYSPWAFYRNYSTPEDPTGALSWFKDYGIPYSTKRPYRKKNGEITMIDVPQYDRTKTEFILKSVNHLFVRATRQELGFEHEPEDEIHYIELNDETKAVYNWLTVNKHIVIGQWEIELDTKIKERTVLHQLEGGTLKHRPFVQGIEQETVFLNLQNSEKIDYIKEVWGDSENLVIMYNYQAEEKKLKAHFEHALILQATSYAEGVDLSGYDHLVIYSQDFSVARHSQRRARQANMERKSPIKVHFLLVKDAISEQVYKTVSKKKTNFVDSVYKRVTLN